MEIIVRSGEEAQNANSRVIGLQGLDGVRQAPSEEALMELPKEKQDGTK